MPAMPRPNKKALKILEKIIGKPDNKQSKSKVIVTSGRIDQGINTTIDSMYNHPI